MKLQLSALVAIAAVSQVQAGLIHFPQLPTAIPTTIPTSLPSIGEIESIVGVASSVLYGLLEPASLPTSVPEAEAEVKEALAALESAFSKAESVVDSYATDVPVLGAVVAAAASGVLSEVEKLLGSAISLAESVGAPLTGATPTLAPPSATGAISSLLGELEGTLATATAVLGGLGGISSIATSNPISNGISNLFKGLGF